MMKPDKKQIFILTEDQEQYTFVQWMEYKQITFIHVPNGGNRNLITGKKLKEQGVKAGFPDLIIFDIPPKRPGFRGVAIEMKKISGSKTSDEQKEWIKKLIHHGWYAAICKGADEAIKTMEELGF